MLQSFSTITQSESIDKSLFLYLKDKRLRHINQISLKNLDFKVNKFSTWFTLHEQPDKQAFFISEKKVNDRSPKWNLKVIQKYECLRSFVIRVWLVNLDEINKGLILFIEMNVHLNGLEQMVDDYKTSQLKNFIQFEIFKIVFTEPLNRNTASVANLANNLNHYLKKPFKNSYQINLINRINDYLRVITDTNQTISNLKQNILRNYEYTSKLRELTLRKEILMEHIKLMKAQIDVNKTKQIDYKRKHVDLQNRYSQCVRQINEQYLVNISLNKKKCDEIEFENKRKLFSLIKLKEKLIKRQRSLIISLSKIYPIDTEVKFQPRFSLTSLQQQQSPQTTPDMYKIANILLPNTDDQQISCALGYISHCLVILTSILNQPLRYPIVYRSSKSVVIDYYLPVINNENETIQEFPLYRSNTVQEQNFNYAIFLLNKNLAQLRILFDGNYKNVNLNCTLGNLKWLLNHI